MPTFESGGKPIQLVHYAPKKSGNHPAVLLVHGSGGPLHGIDTFAAQAANYGVHVFVVHFFDRTGHAWVSPQQIEPNFRAWYETLCDALTCVARQSDVDEKRIVMMGFSLGAFLSLAVAAHDQRVAAVIDFFGGLPKELHHNVGTLPPILILHGDADDVVPVSEAYTLERLCKEHNVPHELHIFKGQGHSFKGLAQMQALGYVVNFLKRVLAKAA